MREIHGFLRLANPFGHPSQVRTQVLVLQTCVDLRVRLARALSIHLGEIVLQALTIYVSPWRQTRQRKEIAENSLFVLGQHLLLYNSVVNVWKKNNNLGMHHWTFTKVGIREDGNQVVFNNFSLELKKCLDVVFWNLFSRSDAFEGHFSFVVLSPLHSLFIKVQRLATFV